MLQVRPAWALGERVHAGRPLAQLLLRAAVRWPLHSQTGASAQQGQALHQVRFIRLQLLRVSACRRAVNTVAATASITVAATALIAVTATVAIAVTAIALITIAAVIRIASRKTSLSRQR